MPRPENPFDREHLRRLQQIQALIDRIYDEAVREAAAIGASVGDFDPSKAFEFADYPLTERRMAELTAWLRSQLSAAVVDGVEAAWTLSNNKNNELVHHVFGDRYDQLPEAARRRYLSTNETARDAFLRRKQQGLGLSERVWRYAEGFKDEMEMGIDLGIRSGKPAAEMARDLKQYLQHPDKLFRRVRDEHGNLHLSKRAAAFHPGRGVYRSSYMNARRLAVTETNMAYRTADHERWRQMDFVVGIEIHLSNNHNCKGVPRGMFTDICDALQGRYPKDFKFTGWHPHCRCYATTVLKTPEEMDADTARILNGEPVDGGSVNKVVNVPEGFRKWVEENSERIENARSLPFWVRDNEGYVSGARPQISGNGAESIRTGETVEPYNGTPDKNGRFVDISQEDMMENLRKLNDNFTHEEAYVKLTNGKVFYKRGDERQVSFNSEERAMFVGGELYHNHKSETLSPDDISFAINNRMKSIVAVTKGINYEARLTAETITMSKDEILKLYKQLGDEIETEMKGMNSVDYMNALLNFQHFNIEALCEKLKVDYKRYSI